MKRRPLISLLGPLLRPLLGVPLACALALTAASAHAGANDEQAKQLAEQALFEDYLNLKFDDAKTKLILAVDLCREQCSPDVKGQIFRDLGVVYVAGLKKRDDGISAFIKGLQAYPMLQLDPDLSNDEIAAAFAEAKTLAASGQSAPAPAEEPEEPSGDDAISHTKVRQAVVNTPLPLWLTVNPDALEADVEKVKVYFRGFGMARFKEEPMGELDNNIWGIELGCEAVGRSRGKFEYYIVVIDEDGDEVTRIGSDANPISVKLMDQVASPPEPIPGTEPPVQCEGPAPVATGSVGSGAWDEDCPPDFPGCGEDAGGDQDEDEPPAGVVASHWFSISFQQDFLLLTATQNACDMQAPSGLSCFYENGQVRDASEFENIPAGPTETGQGDGISDRLPGDSGSVGGGAQLATQRLLLGYDFAVTPNFFVGGKIGFALGGGPQANFVNGAYLEPGPVVLAADGTTPVRDGVTGEEVPSPTRLSRGPAPAGASFVPIHAEVRLSYYFLTDGFFRPYVGLSAGLAQVDGSIKTQVRDARNQARLATCAPAPTGLPGDCWETVDVWQKAGTGFASGNLGALLAFGRSHGVTLEGRFMQLFPAMGSALGAQVGYMMGF